MNSGLFAQMLHSGNIEGMFCGHDHDNDFSFNHYGIHFKLWSHQRISLLW